MEREYRRNALVPFWKQFDSVSRFEPFLILIGLASVLVTVLQSGKSDLSRRAVISLMHQGVNNYGT